MITPLGQLVFYKVFGVDKVIGIVSLIDIPAQRKIQALYGHTGDQFSCSTCSNKMLFISLHLL